MQHGAITERIDEIAAAAAKQNGVEFVRSEMVGSRRNSVVRIFIDKPAGVTIDDCSAVSRSIEEAMDAEDLMPSSYVLEVSSPGLERALVDIGDFERYAGKKAKLKTVEPIEGQANFSGRITSVEASDIVFDDKKHGTVRIPFEKVAKANLKIDLAEEFKKKR
jgi:ribosome maturation factor RimP